MEILVYLIFGHLIGDYVLQNSYIARYKNSRRFVLLVHVLLVMLSHEIVLIGSVFKFQYLVGIFTLGTIHLIIDTVKFRFKQSKFFGGWLYYVLDQFLHLISMIIVLPFFNGVKPFISITIASVSTLAIFNAYFVGILAHFMYGNGIYKRDYFGYLLRSLFPVFYVFNFKFFLIYSIIYLVYILAKRKEYKKEFTVYLIILITNTTFLGVIL